MSSSQCEHVRAGSTAHCKIGAHWWRPLWLCLRSGSGASSEVLPGAFVRLFIFPAASVRLRLLRTFDSQARGQLHHCTAIAHFHLFECLPLVRPSANLTLSYFSLTPLLITHFLIGLFIILLALRQTPTHSNRLQKWKKRRKRLPSQRRSQHAMVKVVDAALESSSRNWATMTTNWLITLWPGLL